MITFGLAAGQQANYIDLLNLPENMVEPLAQAKAVSEDWQPVFTGGLDMSEKLKRFFEGHGNDSVVQLFTPIFRRLKILHDELSGGTPFEELQKELLDDGVLVENWHKLRNRFSNYYPFLSCLPFFNDFETIKNLMEAIHPFFEARCREKNILWHRIV
ncbi:MAG: hypothetical protein HC892_21920 [Saprospiraceae bacterium]|nr:hypothetical protein [Saprospiraceae bacterium]